MYSGYHPSFEKFEPVFDTFDTMSEENSSIGGLVKPIVKGIRERTSRVTVDIVK